MRVLVVEDDQSIAELIEAILYQENYAVDLAADGQIGLELSDSYEYDLILLDVSLPRRDGISICQEIRSRSSQVPIMLLTALDSPVDRARGLNAGADDYLGKPFDPAEFLARIHALLRRSSSLSTPILTWGELQLDPLSATVTYADRSVAVTPKEYAMLELFLRNNKRVFSCNAILDHLWSYDEAPSEEAIRTHIKGLRQKLKKAGATTDYIETVYGIGYRLKPLQVADNPAQTSQLLISTWAKFKDQIHEQVAILEQLTVRFLRKDLPLDWQTTGRQVAHSLGGSLGTFGFPIGSELAKQIEKLLRNPQELSDEQGQHLYSLVAALQQELDRPMPSVETTSSDADNIIMVLVVSPDPDFNRSIRAAAQDRGWHIKIVNSIAIARSQLQNNIIRSILLGSSITDQSEEIVRLLVEVSKHVPVIPVVLNSADTYPEMAHIGICINLPPTSTNQVITALDLAITEVERSQTHVLLVDDDPKVSAILQAMLIPWGLKVTTLSDPEQFWLVVNEVQPNLMILDVEMPGVSGLELCCLVRNHPDWSETPIIFLTSHNAPDLVQEVFAIGADDFVTKPVIAPEIILRILNLLERKRFQRILAQDPAKMNSPPALIPSSKRIQFTLALTQLQESLKYLENDLTPMFNTEVLPLELAEIHQRFQNTHSQLVELQKSILANSLE
jgi:DNA-binding response OmpR family regulator/HPt (histidine-containing phosphotransfer) domain-containing protein